jgi:electron transfer flavoprotein alpha subunit
MKDTSASLFWNLIAPLHEAGNHVAFWLVGPVDIRSTEDCLHWLERLCTARRLDLILFSESFANHDLGVRLAARLNYRCFTETTALLREGNSIFARKNVCGSNLNWDAEIVEYPAVLTVIGKKTANPEKSGAPQCIEKRPLEPLNLPHWLLAYEPLESFPAHPLESASLLFVAGRGMGTKSACNRLRCLAGSLGAPLGFSRPAALNGWGKIAEIIGQSGLRTEAECCITVGVSGAAAFMAGIDPQTTLIAVNPDKHAPIFHYADIGIIAAAQEFIAALEGAIRNK